MIITAESYKIPTEQLREIGTLNYYPRLNFSTMRRHWIIVDDLDRRLSLQKTHSKFSLRNDVLSLLFDTDRLTDENMGVFLQCYFSVLQARFRMVLVDNIQPLACCEHRILFWCLSTLVLAEVIQSCLRFLKTSFLPFAHSTMLGLLVAICNFAIPRAREIDVYVDVVRACYRAVDWFGGPIVQTWSSCLGVSNLNNLIGKTLKLGQLFQL